MKTTVSRFGIRLTVGQRVRFNLARGGHSVGTIKAFDAKSDYARAYGVQVSFTDSPYTVATADCMLCEPSDLPASADHITQGEIASRTE